MLNAPIPLAVLQEASMLHVARAYRVCTHGGGELSLGRAILSNLPMLGNVSKFLILNHVVGQ